jgi:hypothetical protein
MKCTWKLINKEKGASKQETGIQEVMHDNKLIVNQREMADTFNNYILNIAATSNENNKIDISSSIDNSIMYLRNNSCKPFMKMKWKYTNTHEVEKIIKSMKTKDFYGYDEITSRILKASLPFVVSPLTQICNEMLRQGIFPDRLKYTSVKPCFKKGNRQK